MYDFDKPTGFTEATGHFTQLVWKTTTQVGCAAINCGSKHDRNRIRRGNEDLEETQDDSERSNAITGSHLVAREPDGSTRAQGWYVVCEYAPAGNVVGRHDKYFRLNVKQGNSSSSEPTGGASMKSAMESKTSLLVLALITVAIGMSLYG